MESKTIYEVLNDMISIRIIEIEIVDETENTFKTKLGNWRFKNTDFNKHFETKGEAVKFIGMQLIKKENDLKQQLKELGNIIKEYETLYKL